MKRALLLLLLLVFCLLPTGCDRKGGNPSPKPAAAFVSIAYPELVPEAVQASAA